jgi:histidine triad (HIT) family protein
MENCIFCKIVNRQIPSEIVYEDDEIMAFNDINPSAPVHVLIIPKEHIQSIDHLEGNHAGVISKIIFAAKKIANQNGLKGYKLLFNVGREAGQIVDHLHLHLQGGWNKKLD